MKIIVDAMGGDNAPDEIIRGSILARDEYNIDKIILCGRESVVKSNIEKYTNSYSNIEILNAEDIITNEDKPIKAIRRKKDSSLVKSLYHVKNHDADAIVSAGSTGALLGGATLIVGRVSGVQRPCLAPFIPTNKGFSLLVDAGANVDCRPEFLLDFAIMGSIYIQNTMKIKNPTIGLLNIGAEKGKGNKLTSEAYDLLENSNLNFVGNIESRDVLNGDVDVIVADGFIGNIMLKSIEGCASFIMNGLKQDLLSSTMSKIGALLVRPSLRKFKKRLDYGEYGGAMLLGVNAPVIKAHGSSDSTAIKNAIKQTKNIIDNNVVELIRENMLRR